jgi:hypothetical protein
MTDLYLATINTPGYLPMDDDRHVFTDPRDAWAYLASERERAEDQTDSDMGEYSDTWRILGYIASGEHRHGNPCEDWPTAADGTGSVRGDTPGREDSAYDLGEAYSVTLWAHAGYPHEHGAHYDCDPCEYTCHNECTPEGPCVHCALVASGESVCESDVCESVGHG